MEEINTDEYYVVQQADLDAYPELVEQGVTADAQVAWGSLTVSKRGQLEAWPRKIQNFAKGITFDG